jgi:short-subunit dehydrogenase
MQTTNNLRKLVVVTGSNKGIGYSIAQGLCRLSADSNHTESYKVVITSRSLDKANASKSKILAEFPDSEIDTLQLDLLSEESFTQFA